MASRRRCCCCCCCCLDLRVSRLADHAPLAPRCLCRCLRRCYAADQALPPLGLLQLLLQPHQVAVALVLVLLLLQPYQVAVALVLLHQVAVALLRITTLSTTVLPTRLLR